MEEEDRLYGSEVVDNSGKHCLLNTRGLTQMNSETDSTRLTQVKARQNHSSKKRKQAQVPPLTKRLLATIPARTGKLSVLQCSALVHRPHCRPDPMFKGRWWTQANSMVSVHFCFVLLVFAFLIFCYFVYFDFCWFSWLYFFKERKTIWGWESKEVGC